MRQRLGGKADYADRVRLGEIILIVRDLDENDHIQSVGMSLEALEPATILPIFVNLHDILTGIRGFLRKRREQAEEVVSTDSNTGKNDA
jgi:cell volume regulation protein A